MTNQRKSKVLKINRDLDKAFDRVMELMVKSDYGGKQVHYPNGWKIKAWITRKDLAKQRLNNLGDES